MGDRVGKAEAAVANLLATALMHRRAGRLDDAEGLYRQILVVHPGHADGLHLLGVVAHARGHNELAIDLIGKAIAKDDRIASYHRSAVPIAADLVAAARRAGLTVV